MTFKPLEVPKNWFDNNLAAWPQKLRYTDQNDLSEAVEVFASSSGILKISNQRRNALESIILNLVFRDFVSLGQGCLHVLTASSTGRDTIQYSVFGISGDTLRSIVDSLKATELIEHQVGFSYSKIRKKVVKGKAKKVNEGDSSTSKIKLSKKGKKLLESHINIANIYSEPMPMLYGAKNQEAKVLNIETARTKRAKVLKEYNQLIGETEIKVGDYPLYQPELLVFRKFVDASAKKDGRLYGSIFQRLKKEVRRSITINGEPTIEVDIVATHTLIAYALEGVDITKKEGFKPKQTDSFGDPYGFGLLIDSDDKEIRNFAKSLVNRSYNLKSSFVEDRKAFYQELNLSLFNPNSKNETAKDREDRKQRICVKDRLLADAQKESPNIKIEDIYDALFQRHAKIHKYFGNESWSLFNTKESAILLEVIDHFNNMNIPILHVHDSVRIAAKYKDELESVYVDAISKVLKPNFRDKSRLVDTDEKETSYSDEELKQALLQSRCIVDW
jgi:hypothetical protein